MAYFFLAFQDGVLFDITERIVLVYYTNVSQGLPTQRAVQQEKDALLLNRFG
jgi:hypothetical protein